MCASWGAVVKADLTNGAALLASLALAVYGATRPINGGSESHAQRTLAAAEDALRDVLVDARGVAVRAGDYQRIVSLHLVADHLLLDIVEPSRLVAVSHGTLETHPNRWRFGSVEGVRAPYELEAVLGLQPDLVVLSNYGDDAFSARLREHGVSVFNLGEMRGIGTTREDIRTLGRLLLQPERASLLEQRWDRELSALQQAVASKPHPKGIYLSMYGDAFFGGTQGTSHADILALAGVDDLAAAHGFRDWPQFGVEQLLDIDPPLIVTQQGMGATICDRPAFATLRACNGTGRVVELPRSAMTDPGWGIVHTAQVLQELVHGVN